MSNHQSATLQTLQAIERLRESVRSLLPLGEQRDWFQEPEVVPSVCVYELPLPHVRHLRTVPDSVVHCGLRKSLDCAIRSQRYWGEDTPRHLLRHVFLHVESVWNVGVYFFSFQRHGHCAACFFPVPVEFDSSGYGWIQRDKPLRLTAIRRDHNE